MGTKQETQNSSSESSEPQPAPSLEREPCRDQIGRGTDTNLAWYTCLINTQKNKKSFPKSKSSIVQNCWRIFSPQQDKTCKVSYILNRLKI